MPPLQLLIERAELKHKLYPEQCGVIFVYNARYTESIILLLKGTQFI